MAFNPLAGKDASVTVGMTTYNFKVTDVEMKSKLGDVTGYLSGGKRQFVDGPIDAKLTCRGSYDGGNMTFAVGSAYTLVVAYSLSINISIPTLCESIKLTADVENPDEVNIVFQSNGDFTASIS